MYFLDSHCINDDNLFNSYTLEYLKKYFVHTLCINVFGRNGSLKDDDFDKYYNDPLIAGLVFSDIIKKIKNQKGKRELRSYLRALKKVLE